MKLGKWHLILRKVTAVNVYEISSYYFNVMRLNHSDADCQLMTKGFEEGYKRAMADLGIKTPQKVEEHK
ncbi:hypothetical protein SAMN06265348_101165 [Pedobacter westerhofensis]|uniref:Uncharacterized protein n=1 Tax=Pedobacter westerhofensis TaxID=425512 RepID=A0A521AG71_9SPHI|nr:hypothetical protein [Pedobacter westerhofensis]SMO33825.1 hypothetical protein SAMN06265348_101165 [Pedobacter westerhofensis]